MTMIMMSVERLHRHVKTVKCAWVVQALLDAGVRQFKCATSREAELLAMQLKGMKGTVLVAFAHSGPNLRRLARVAEAHPDVDFSVVAESAEGAKEVLAASELGIFVDINAGMDRSGCAYDDTREVALAAGPRFRGLHMYDGHAMS